jgi:hypothetical protein
MPFLDCDSYVLQVLQALRKGEVRKNVVEYGYHLGSSGRLQVKEVMGGLITNWMC